MMTIRLYRALMWIGAHWLAQLPFTDQWGFNLGRDLDDWALMRTCRYLDRAQHVARLEPVQVTARPPLASANLALGSTVTLTRTFP